MAGKFVQRVLVAACAVTAIASIQAQRSMNDIPPKEGVATRLAADRCVTVNLENVSLEVALKAIARQAGVTLTYTSAVIPRDIHISLHARDLPVAQAFTSALQGTGLEIVLSTTGHAIVLASAAASPVVSEGSVSGRVTDTKTRQPVRDATVKLDGMATGVLTGNDGQYRIANVAKGAHTITVKCLGYVQQRLPVTVTDDAVTTLDVSLELSANVLEQVVVTGTVVQTELKAVPNAITVITAKQIEERGITKIDQLFRGDVPGLFAQNRGSDYNALLDEVTMFSRGATALSGISVPGSIAGTTNPIKTYVDGVELADSRYLSQIDPKSIERIEILTGPQASTIYGSNAINGVMQIFTKRGTSLTPQLTLNLLSGWVENNFSSARTPQHDYSAQLSGGEGRLSYSAGGSWNYMGPWTPAKQSARTGASGGVRLELPTPTGRATADMTLRRTLTQSLQRGNPQQTLTGYVETGWYRPDIGITGLDRPTTRTLTNQTLGLTLNYALTGWWSHELSVGQDISETETRTTARGYTSTSDTTLELDQSHADRRSLRYATTVRVPVTSFAQATITAGADAWQDLASYWSVSPQTLTGTLTGNVYVSRQPSHNTGGFLQTQIGVDDRLFFTYGLRAEWNPGFGADAQPNYAPRYGIAYTQELGPVTAKLRGSYGRSTRPPQPQYRATQTVAEAFGSFWTSTVSLYYPPFDFVIGNPDLGPEHQQGGEGGLELYLGTHGSLVVTRYNQTVDGLIDSPAVDSVFSLTPCRPTCPSNYQGPDGFGYIYQIQYVNIGAIRNQGWELQGNAHVGPITTRGTYSWTKSRTIGVTPKYRAQFANIPQYQIGAAFQLLPEHTWALGVTYANASSTVGLNVTGTGQVMIENNEFSFRSLYGGSIRLPQNRLIASGRPYVSFNNAYALADLTASHRFLPRVEGVLQVQNLADHYTNDFSGVFASMGRQVKLGARVR